MSDLAKTTREQRVKPSAHMGQRRAHLRFEVLGSMTASLLSTETLHILNLGASGALVEGPLPLPANAEYQMQLVLDSHVSEATVKVRRVTPVSGEQGSVRYRIGLEFLAISPEAEDAIGQIVMANQAQV
jgi:hypothetical protein